MDIERNGASSFSLTSSSSSSSFPPPSFGKAKAMKMDTLGRHDHLLPPFFPLLRESHRRLLTLGICPARVLLLDKGP